MYIKNATYGNIAVMNAYRTYQKLTYEGGVTGVLGASIGRFRGGVKGPCLTSELDPNKFPEKLSGASRMQETF